MAHNIAFPEREIRSCRATVTFGKCPLDQVDNLKPWLESQMHKRGFKFLLAHAENGVIWGKYEDNERHLVLSGEVWHDGPKLLKAHLQQLRLFSNEGELMIWHDDFEGWLERLILDGDYEPTHFEEAIDEPQMLWGTYATEPPGHENSGFSLMAEGQGLRHAVPCEVRGEFNAETRPLRLLVRHYLKDDDDPDTDTGFTRIALSRLVDVYAV